MTPQARYCEECSDEAIWLVVMGRNRDRLSDSNH
jgi:hypothetical protein